MRDANRTCYKIFMSSSRLCNPMTDRVADLLTSPTIGIWVRQIKSDMKS